MDRLTSSERGWAIYANAKSGWPCNACCGKDVNECDACSVARLLEALCSYEDTGLTPEQIDQLRRERDAAVRDIKNGWTCRACKNRTKGREWAKCDHADIKHGPESIDVCQGFQWRGVVTDIPNQAHKADAGKPRLTLVPQQIIYDIARAREYGLKKYGTAESWREVEPERYRDAMFRHLLAYLDDPDGVDEESGLPHLAHLACNVAFLCEMEKQD